MDLTRIAARIAREKTAIPEGWKLITDEQIEEVMKRMPPGSEVYGSQATGKTRPGSDLDIKLPHNIGEEELTRLVLKTMRDLDLYLGAINIGMPCDKHDDCMVIVHVDEGNLLPPHLEHLTGFEEAEALPKDTKERREQTRKHVEKFLKNKKMTVIIS